MRDRSSLTLHNSLRSNWEEEVYAEEKPREEQYGGEYGFGDILG
jgi:hypothetical protein